MKEKIKLDAAQRIELLQTLKNRFEKSESRHPGIRWADVEHRLAVNEGKLASLHGMEITGGEPDVVGRDDQTGEVLFFDCSPESPGGRRNLCYDREALDSRKEHKPAGSAWDMARDMDLELLDEEQYRRLQELGEFDTKTSSWIKTPDDVRKRGGALFADRRYGRVFFYHNGAPSYYGVRGFRGVLKV
jgi:hypothetical protein